MLGPPFNLNFHQLLPLKIDANIYRPPLSPKMAKDFMLIVFVNSFRCYKTKVLPSSFLSFYFLCLFKTDANTDYLLFCLIRKFRTSLILSSYCWKRILRISLCHRLLTLFSVEIICHLTKSQRLPVNIKRMMYIIMFWQFDRVETSL